MKRAQLAVWIGGVGLAMTALACGDSDSPTQPSPPPGGGGGAAPMAVTITVSGTGVSASSATLASGGTITWVNSDSRAHEMSSNPHPQHTDCPAINSGALNPGQQRATGPITTVRTCGFHDHMNPGTQSLTGQITIQ